MDGAQYYFKVNDLDRDRRPRGVFRRGGTKRDEMYDFTQDAWVATDFFERYRLGHDDWDPLETSAAEAEEYIAATRLRRSQRAT